MTGALERTRDGRGGAVLLLGDAGLGKTCLARALAEVAAAGGDRVLWGQAHAPERDVPYAPLVEALSTALASAGPRLRTLLVEGLPDLGSLLPQLGLTPPPAPDPGLARARLFDAVVRVVERLAGDAPVLLVVDDLQWSDEATVALLHHLVRRLEGDRFLLVATCRTTDADAAGLRAARRSLARLGLLVELRLAPLDRAATAALAAAALDGPAPADVVDLLVTRSGGVPLFVEALARAVREGAPLLPDPVRDVLAEQLESLDAEQRAVLDVLAVHDAPLPYALVAEACGLPEGPLLSAVEALQRLGILVPVPDGLLPAHPLLAETAAAELPDARRRRLHLALARVLQRHAPDDLDRRAHHERGAGDLADRDTALGVLLAAGDRARDVYAHDAAVRWYTAALAAARRPGDQRLLPVVLERLGEASLRCGEVDRAVELWQEALDVGVERDVAGRLRALLATAERDRGHLDAARAHLDAGVGLFVGHPRAPALATLLRARAALLERLDDVPALATTVATLQAIAGPDAPPRLPVDVGVTQAALLLRRRSFAAARAALDAALRVAEQAEDVELELTVRDAAVVAALEVADLDDVRAHAQRLLALADRVGAPASLMRAHGCRAVAAFLAGDRAATDDAVAAAVDLARRLQIPRALASALATRALVAALRADLRQAEADLDEASAVAARVAVDRHVAGDLAMARCRVALEAGDVVTACGLVPALTAPGGRNVAFRLGLAGEALLAAEDRDAALALADTLVALDRHDAFSAAHAARLRGLARLPSAGADRHASAGAGRGAGAGAAIDVDAAWVELCAAADAFASLGVHVEAARTLADLPLSHRSAETVQRLRTALVVLEQAGLRRCADQARSQLRRLGERPAPPRRRPAASGPLSERELEVARLFAEGLTTAEVAARLVISPHTATTHLRHIYGRLDVRSRAALTRALLDQALL